MSGKPSTAAGSGLSHALAVAARIGAAVLMGYAITYVAAGAASLVMPLPRTEAVLWASIASFMVYTAVAIYAFAAASVLRMWRNLLLALALLSAVVALVPA
ncbi:MAG TPA: iron transporter [Xanthobacteraceae bacterium]|nr:iron transporter [Xanthobacteraceae bacterium]